MEKLLREEDVCKWLRISPRTLQRWRFNGTGPIWIRLRSRIIRYPESEVADFIKYGPDYEKIKKEKRNETT